MQETKLRIRILGDPVLRKKSRLIKKVTHDHTLILSQMAQMMYDSDGVGLAGPQVGLSESMIVVDAGTGLYKLINPKIIKKEGTQVNQEGCLSVPGVCVNVKRAKKVLIKALDENGKALDIEAEDLLACVFQHEIDHLSGMMIVDHASFLDKIKLRKKLKSLNLANSHGLPEPEKKCSKL